MNRELGITPDHGETHKGVAPVKVTEEMHSAVQTFAEKLSKGIFFIETNRIFPRAGKLALNWFTNAELIRSGHYPIFKLLAEVQGVVPTLKRNRQFLNDQFSYKYSGVPDADMFVLQVSFGTAFGFLVFGAEQAGRLEAMLANMEAKTGRKGPFVLL
ncbi:hypothetical protein [Massilia horti]|uniref:Uncharacterized protein n=1 Tax=Massilia horti TaxID=2562153 RepID=A0A4Y9T2C8_9BURK|nr:hypothetical protein [Massilia horti]TFW31756.1 hypothetical protein E4O92_12465 [Massilia horti]